MDVEKILIAIEERERWKERELELKNEIKSSSRGEREAKREELQKVKVQVAYYDALTRDMKKSVNPSNISHLLNSLLQL